MHLREGIIRRLSEVPEGLDFDQLIAALRRPKPGLTEGDPDFGKPEFGHLNRVVAQSLSQLQIHTNRIQEIDGVFSLTENGRGFVSGLYAGEEDQLGDETKPAFRLEVLCHVRSCSTGRPLAEIQQQLRDASPDVVAQVVEKNIMLSRLFVIAGRVCLTEFGSGYIDGYFWQAGNSHNRSR